MFVIIFPLEVFDFGVTFSSITLMDSIKKCLTFIVFRKKYDLQLWYLKSLFARCNFYIETVPKNEYDWCKKVNFFNSSDFTAIFQSL